MVGVVGVDVLGHGVIVVPENTGVLLYVELYVFYSGCKEEWYVSSGHLGSKSNFCPPILASYMRPPLAMVNTITPFW